MSLEVRPMEKGDLEALAALEALCFSEPWSQEFASEFSFFQIIITVRRTSVGQSATNQLVFMEMCFLSSLPLNVVSNRRQTEP